MTLLSLVTPVFLVCLALFSLTDRTLRRAARAPGRAIRPLEEKEGRLDERRYPKRKGKTKIIK